MKKFFSFVKIEHTLFSLPMIYAGMALGLDANRADGLVLDPGTIIQKAFLILGAATGARTVGFAVNRIVDRHIDAKNPRTAGRELPSGKMTMGSGVRNSCSCTNCFRIVRGGFEPAMPRAFNRYHFLCSASILL